MVRNRKHGPKVVSLFAGCGGLALGFYNAGFKRVWANDFEPFYTHECFFVALQLNMSLAFSLKRK
jgi:tRNA G37 N-methylase Trm5